MTAEIMLGIVFIGFFAGFFLFCYKKLVFACFV